MILDIPGRETIEIKNVVFDYNGTIAIDGHLIAGVAERINALSGDVDFYVITADTYGSVQKELSNIRCSVVKIPKERQDQRKRDFLLKLGKEATLCVGNGRNDSLMLKDAALGIAIIQAEGVCVESLLAADIACNSILDVFAFLKVPNRIKATLRN